MNRTEIVTNGCSGGCCECFTLPLSIEDIDKMLDAYTHNESIGYDVEKHYRWEDRDKFPDRIERIKRYNGLEIGLPPKKELLKLKDMLIPLGETDICPQEKTSWTEKYQKDIESKLCEINTYKLSGHYNITFDNFKITAKIFTCKHFDTVNKICGNYENRPQLCKDFGKHCKYENCTCAEKMIEESANGYVELMSDEDCMKATPTKLEDNINVSYE